MSESMLRWVNTHPFGRPVVPDVYTIVAGSLALPACRRNAVGSPWGSDPPSISHTVCTVSRASAVCAGVSVKHATAPESDRIQATCSALEVS
jgi:hypothetical protein